MNVVLDSSFVIALSNEVDSHKEIAVSLFNNLAEDTPYIPFLVMGECLVKAQDQAGYLESLLDITKENPLPELEDLTVFSQLDISDRKSLKVIDCLTLAICERLKARLLTFDDKLASVASSRGVIVNK